MTTRRRSPRRATHRVGREGPAAGAVGEPAFELSPVALVTLSRAGIVQQMNLAAAALLEISRDEMLRKPFSPFIAPGSRASFLRLIGGGRTPGTPQAGRTSLLRADGREIQARALVRGAADGQVFVALFESESPRKQAAARRRAVAEQEARESGEARERFIAMLSHELRAPLTPLLFATEALEKHEWKREDLRRWTDLVRRSVTAEVRLIDDLLDVTRITRGKMSIEPCTMDLHADVAAALETMAPAIAEKDLRMEVDLAAPIPWVNGDPLRLRQVFWNLISNAVKFTVRGGSVAVRSWCSDTSLAVEVSDSGVGLDPAEQERIFRPFEQVRRGAGLGLGLSIVKGILDLHGGRITVASPGKNKGARFVVELPAVAAPTREFVPMRPAKPAVLVSRELPGQRARILLVEDDEDILQSLRELLELAGYRVTAAASPAAAFAVDLNQIDIVVADIGLPEMTGWEMLRKMRRRRVDLPAIAMSGYGTENDRRASREAGFAAHLTKPVDPEDLIAKIRAVSMQTASGQNRPPTISVPPPGAGAGVTDRESDGRVGAGAARLLSSAAFSEGVKGSVS